MTRIEQASGKDAAALLGLIRELAIFEDLEHEVVATETDLRELLEGSGTFAAMLAYADDSDEPVAYAVYYETYSTFTGKPGIFLEDLFVKKDYQRKGIGLALFKAVAQKAQEKDCGRFEWEALDWNENAHRFYKNLGATMLRQWLPFRMDAPAIAKLLKG